MKFRLLNWGTWLIGLCGACLATHTLLSQTLLAQRSWEPYFVREVTRIEAQSSADLASVTADNWDGLRAQWRGELREMLGLEPLPTRHDLHTTVTGSIHHDGLTIERLHYQSLPGLYVAANLYMPHGDAPPTGWPAVLYVCGHANVEDAGRKLGNKTAYHHHGLWFARHGVACLIIDTVQLGELHGEHHGTYKLGRWDWISRGYTPAGVETWNSIRGIDVLQSWPGIDGGRIGITGRSGGGAYSWFAAALDDRIKVAVPVAGITDLRNHVLDGCVEGHCDCMYFANYFEWDYPKLAALIAPRPLLLANSDSDGIFPLDGVLRTHGELVKLYRKLAASQNYGVLITPGPHKDTQELQVGAFRWLLRTLKGEEAVVDQAALKELDAQQLAVFERETPSDERVAAVGSWFVPRAATVTNPQQAAQKFREQWLPALRKTTLAMPLRTLTMQPDFEEISIGATASHDAGDIKLYQAQFPDGLTLSVLKIGRQTAQHGESIMHLGAIDDLPCDPQALSAFAASPAAVEYCAEQPDAAHYFVQTRGAGWQQSIARVMKQNQVIRRFYLIGQMPEQLQLADALASLQLIARHSPADALKSSSVQIRGANRWAAIATLAGLLCVAQVDSHLPDVGTLHLTNYPTDPELAPALPGLLRICDYASLLAAARGSLQVDVLHSTEASQSPRRLVDSATEPQQANGMRIVEVSQNTATVWVRATRWGLPNLGDMPEVQFTTSAPPESATSPTAAALRAREEREADPILPETGVEGLQYAVPGVAAEVRVAHRHSGDWSYSEWVTVDESTDFSALVKLENLLEAQSYTLETQVRAVGSQGPINKLTGDFQTLPAVGSYPHFRLAVGTCQAFPDRDGPHGFDLYRTMSNRETDAFIMAGDVVYYDKLARSLPLAYYHWQRTYSLPTLLNFHRRVPTYFLKDDHDTYVNDSWPGQRHPWTRDFTFEDGQRIFIQESGLPSPAYRTFQIGQDLQVWLMEGRDFRSPNDAPDGPGKSIWGTAQKEWLEQTLDASTAKFKVVVSPTPLVGPDRENKRDNHSNKVFQFEGDAVRHLLATHPNTVSVCGDRHWQYHSIDPKSGLHEFSVGPASDRHAGGWKPEDYRAGIHQYLRVAGGYLEIELAGPAAARTLVLRHLDTSGVEQHQHVLR